MSWGEEFAKATLNSGIKLGLMTTVDVSVIDTPYNTAYYPVPLLRKIDYKDLMISFMWTLGIVHPNPKESHRRAILERLPLPLPLSDMLINADEVDRFAQCLSLWLVDHRAQHNSYGLAKAINKWIKIKGYTLARTSDPPVHDKLPIRVFESIIKRRYLIANYVNNQSIIRRGPFPDNFVVHNEIFFFTCPHG